MLVNTYYDPLYGRIKLHPIVGEMISSNPELIRLRSVGMMNFRSLSMLSLTSVNRLEHSIGIAYLITIFAQNNSVVAKNINEFLTAALYHDINCASFGHAIEWAISRHDEYDHEDVSAWVADGEVLACLRDKPIYVEQDGLHRHEYSSKYSLDFKLINNILSGDRTCVINSSGIDLDNIDNVCRMGFYLGTLKNKNFPVELVSNLRLSKDEKFYLLPRGREHLINEWLSVRSSVYHNFIYSAEYMSFEYLLFSLVEGYALTAGKDSVRNLFHFTDERLLWTLYNESQYGETVSSTARRLLLHDLPVCHGIVRLNEFSRYDEIRVPSFCKKISEDISLEAVKAGLIPKEKSKTLAVHLTSDDRKTQRAVKVMVEEKYGTECLREIGENRQYILMGIIGDFELSQAKQDNLLEIATNVVSNMGFTSEVAMFAENEDKQQLALF
jgi:HD superfamily phosphohydrolase